MNRVIVSAGDAITARLVEQAGFDGIWISGFEASARLGLEDNGSITMTEMLNIARSVVKAVQIPVYVDVDTGYGNFQRTVTEFENIGVHAICVEDNLPTEKVNSLWGGDMELMDADVFCTKITSAKRSSLQIIARTEGLIRGLGVKRTLERVIKYSRVADMVLPHCRDIKTLIKFKSNYGVPLAIVPTKFPYVTNDDLFRCGYNLVIWANQTERVKIKSIRECLKTLKKDDSAKNIESKLSVTLDDMKGLTYAGTHVA